MASLQDGSAPLHWAAVSGREGVVRLLLDRGADIAAMTKVYMLDTSLICSLLTSFSSDLLFQVFVFSISLSCPLPTPST